MTNTPGNETGGGEQHIFEPTELFRALVDQWVVDSEETYPGVEAVRYTVPRPLFRGMPVNSVHIRKQTSSPVAGQGETVTSYRISFKYRYQLPNGGKTRELHQFAYEVNEGPLQDPTAVKYYGAHDLHAPTTTLEGQDADFAATEAYNLATDIIKHPEAELAQERRTDPRL